MWQFVYTHRLLRHICNSWSNKIDQWWIFFALFSCKSITSLKILVYFKGLISSLQSMGMSGAHVWRLVYCKHIVDVSQTVCGFQICFTCLSISHILFFNYKSNFVFITLNCYQTRSNIGWRKYETVGLSIALKPHIYSCYEPSVTHVRLLQNYSQLMKNR